MSVEIKKLNYSSNPWRLLWNGEEVHHPVKLDHPDLGETMVPMPVCGKTKAEVMQAALDILVLQRNAMKKLLDENKRLNEQVRELTTAPSVFACDKP